MDSFRKTTMTVIILLLLSSLLGCSSLIHPRERVLVLLKPLIIPQSRSCQYLVRNPFSFGFSATWHSHPLTRKRRRNWAENEWQYQLPYRGLHVVAATPQSTSASSSSSSQTWSTELSPTQLPSHEFLFPPTTTTITELTTTTTTTTTTATTQIAAISANVKYPTQRGSEVDARKIISIGVGRQCLQAMHLQHCLFATEELARSTLHQWMNHNSRSRSSSSVIGSFADLARSVSACTATRAKGGTIGWITVLPPLEEINNNKNAAKTDVTVDAHLDEILPQDARLQVPRMSTKPGDVIIVQSDRGYHLIQIVDVMVDVRRMAQKKRMSNSRIRQLQQLPDGGAPITLTDRVQGWTYKMESMGCQMNAADSERIEGQLQSIGIQPHVDGIGKLPPNVVVLNTCSIRQHAEEKVYSYLGPYAKRKREQGNGSCRDDLAIIVAGCVAQQEGERLLRRIPEIDLVMGPQYANRLADLLEDVLMNQNQLVATEASHIMEDSTKPRRQSTVAAWVNVIYGCNERCTFCIVPTTRGVEQSRPVESIVREVTELVEMQGYQEITLLGQNIDAYGRDMMPKRKFSDLIRAVGTVPGLKRLRFVTSHPRYMSLGVVDAVAETPAACECFHIPFQSGSNVILEAMGRGHTREKYLYIVNRIRSRIPDAAITADVIVGFPGETEQDFQDTLSLMDEVVFDTVNTAAYSPRPNTPAALWSNQVDETIKQERLLRINDKVRHHAAQRRARFMDQTVDVLVEERNIKVPSQVMGRSRQGYIVYCEREQGLNTDIDELRGQIHRVKIHTCQTYYLVGTIVQEENAYRLTTLQVAPNKP